MNMFENAFLVNSRYPKCVFLDFNNNIYPNNSLTKEPQEDNELAFIDVLIQKNTDIVQFENRPPPILNPI